jgi:threonyl-tRNA synthetase
MNTFDLEIENSKPVRAKSDDALNIMRHDMAHVLAEGCCKYFSYC